MFFYSFLLLFCVISSGVSRSFPPFSYFLPPLPPPPPPAEFGKDPCRYMIYKDPDKIPAKYYERYGLKKNAKRA